MGLLWEVGKFLLKVASDKIVGRERTEELAKLISSCRSSAAPAEEGRTTLQTLVQEERDDEWRARAEVILDELPLKIADAEIDPGKLAKDLLDSLPGTSGTYLLWLGSRIIEDKDCYCHFYWEWNKDKGQMVYSLRDFIHGKLYCAHRTTPRPTTLLAAVTDWSGKHSALEVWRSALRRMRCRGVLEYKTADEKAWKETLEEMTVKLAPESARPRE